jgi:hypothetical protein
MVVDATNMLEDMIGKQQGEGKDNINSAFPLAIK